MNFSTYAPMTQMEEQQGVENADYPILQKMYINRNMRTKFAIHVVSRILNYKS